MAYTIKTKEQYFNTNQYLLDVAKTTRSSNAQYAFDDIAYKTVAESGDNEKVNDYLTAVILAQDKKSSDFNSRDYSYLNGQDRVDYFYHKFYGDKNAEDYAKNDEYFQTKVKQAIMDETYNNLNDFQRFMSTTGLILANAGNRLYGTIEGIIDAGILLGGAVSGLFTGGATDEAIKNAIAFDVTGTGALQNALNDAAYAYSYLGKSGFADAVNEIVGSIAQMVPMFIGGGVAGAVGGVAGKIAQIAGTTTYYLGMAGNTASEAIAANKDISLGDLFGYTAAVTGVEIATESLSDVLLGGVGTAVDRWTFGAPKTATNALSKFAAKSGATKILASFGSEALEEMVSEVFDNLLYNSIVAHKDWGIKDVVYAGLIGGITGGILEGVRIAGTTKIDGYNKVQSLILKENLGNVSETFGKTKNYVDSLFLEKQKSDNIQSIDELKSKFGEEYNRALEQDAEQNKKLADALVGLSKIYELIGEKNFVKATDILNQTYEENQRLAQNYLNRYTGTTAANKVISEGLSKAYPDVTFNIDGTENFYQRKISETARKKYGTDIIWADIGSNLPANKNGRAKQKYYKIGNNAVVIDKAVTDASVEAAVEKVANIAVAEAILDDNISSKEFEKGFRKAYGIDASRKLSRADLLEMVQEGLFNPITIQNTFLSDKNVFSKEFKSLYNYKNKELKKTNKTELDKKLLNIASKSVNNFAKISSNLIGNDSDVNALIKLLNVENDPEMIELIKSNTSPDAVNAHYTLLDKNFSTRTIARMAANKALLKQFKTKLTDLNQIDWNNIFNSEIYNPDFVKQISAQNPKRSFRYNLQEYFVQNFGFAINQENGCFAQVLNYLETDSKGNYTNVNNDFVSTLEEAKNENDYTLLYDITSVADVVSPEIVDSFRANGVDLSKHKIEFLPWDAEKSSFYDYGTGNIYIYLPSSIDVTDSYIGDVTQSILHETTHALADEQGLANGVSPKVVSDAILELPEAKQNAMVEVLSSKLLSEEGKRATVNSRAARISDLGKAVYLMTDCERLAGAQTITKSKQAPLQTLTQLKAGYLANDSGFKAIRNSNTDTVLIEGYGKFSGILLQYTEELHNVNTYAMDISGEEKSKSRFRGTFDITKPTTVNKYIKSQYASNEHIKTADDVNSIISNNIFTDSLVNQYVDDYTVDSFLESNKNAIAKKLIEVDYDINSEESVKEFSKWFADYFRKNRDTYDRASSLDAQNPESDNAYVNNVADEGPNAEENRILADNLVEDLLKNLNKNTVNTVASPGNKKNIIDVLAARLNSEAEAKAIWDERIAPRIKEIRGESADVTKGLTKAQLNKYNALPVEERKFFLNEIAVEKKNLSVTTAPYLATSLNVKNEAELKQISKNYMDKANTFATDLGIEISDINENLGGYTMQEGRLEGQKIDELSYTFKFENATKEQADLFACLMGDLGNENQEAVISANHTNKIEGKNNGVHYKLYLQNVNTTEDALAIGSELRKNGISDYSINRDLNTLDVYFFPDSDLTAEQNRANNDTLSENLGKVVDEIKEKIYGQDIEITNVESRYLDRSSREKIYKNILSDDKARRKNGESGLYSQKVLDQIQLGIDSNVEAQKKADAEKKAYELEKKRKATAVTKTELESKKKTVSETKPVVEKKTTSKPVTKTELEAKKQAIAEKKTAAKPVTKTELETKKKSLPVEKKVTQEVKKTDTDVMKYIQDSIESSPLVENEVQGTDTTQSHRKVNYAITKSDVFKTITTEEQYENELKKANTNEERSYLVEGMFNIRHDNNLSDTFIDRIDKDYQALKSDAGKELNRQARLVNQKEIRKEASKLSKELKERGYTKELSMEDIESVTDSKIMSDVVKDLSNKIKVQENIMKSDDSTFDEKNDAAYKHTILKETLNGINAGDPNITLDAYENYLSENKTPKEYQEAMDKIYDKLSDDIVEAINEGQEIRLELVAPEEKKVKAFPEAAKKIDKFLKKSRNFRMWAMTSSPVSWLRNALGNRGMTILGSFADSLERQFDKSFIKKGLISEDAIIYNNTKGGNKLYEAIKEAYGDAINEAAEGNHKYGSDEGKQSAVIEKTKQKLKTANGFAKIIAEAQFINQWGLETGPFGDIRVVVHDIIKNLSNAIASSNTYLLNNISGELKVLQQIIDNGNTLTSDQQVRYDLCKKALETNENMDIFEALSPEVMRDLIEKCKVRSLDLYFKSPNGFSKFVSDLAKRSPILGEVMSWVVPFPKVGANILKMAYRYSPAGFLSAVLNMNKGKQQLKAYNDLIAKAEAETDVDKATKLREQADLIKWGSESFNEYYQKASRGFSESTVGTFALLAGALAAALGWVAIDDDDYLGLSLNLKPLNLKISLSDLAPSMTTFSTAASFIYGWKNNKDGFKLALNTIYDNTLLGNIENIFRYSTPESYMQNLSISYFSQYIPSAIKLVTKLTTNRAYIDKTGNYWQKLFKTLGSYIPGVASALPKKINPYTGKVSTDTNTDNGLINFLATISPLDIKITSSNNSLESEAKALNTGTTGLSGTFTIKGVEYTLQNAEKEKYAKIRAEYISNKFKDIQSGKESITLLDKKTNTYKTKKYSALSTEEKQRVLTRLYSDGTEYVKEQYAKDHNIK